MASSLSLTSSAPDPEENLPHSSDEQSGHESAISVENGTADEILASSPDASSVNAPQTSSVAEPEDVFGVLRRSIADESQPPDSVIRAVSEAARVLTGAEGVAIAFRTKGVILCRARSGELAPDLGSFVNANSGISGECLRTASILVCEDARNDPRVDNFVCERMGIRSIVVVPLRGPVGIAGILEVFSSRGNAFGNREINCLRGLAELAEAAYERERQAQHEATRAALRSAHRLPALLARAVGGDPDSDGTLDEISRHTDDSRPERIWWAFGVAIALLLILGVWLSWHGPISELTELEAAETHGRVTQTTPQSKDIGVPPKPEAGRFAGPARTVALQTAAARASEPGHPLTQQSSIRKVESNAGVKQTIAPEKSNTLPDTSNSVAPAPAVDINAAQNGSELTRLLSDPQPLPVMAAPVSRGVTQGELVRKIDPVYPAQAHADRISGGVVLEIRVNEDGSVSDARRVSGDAQLATAALEAVRQWRYTPTLLDGHPIATTKQVTVLFKLP